MLRQSKLWRESLKTKVGRERKGESGGRREGGKEEERGKAKSGISLRNVEVGCLGKYAVGKFQGF